MANVRHKDPANLVNRRGGRGRGVALSGRPEGWRMPALPRTVTAPLTDPVQARFGPAALRHAREIWKLWWSSPPSQAVDLRSDIEALNWWILCVFRRALYIQVVREQPLVKGSMGQAVRNPLEASIREQTIDINRATDRFGMDTLSRFRLHFEVPEAAQGEDKLAALLARRAMRPTRDVTPGGV